jgi:hypothetical protein
MTMLLLVAVLWGVVTGIVPSWAWLSLSTIITLHHKDRSGLNAIMAERDNQAHDGTMPVTTPHKTATNRSIVMAGAQ